jgi:hypothetical protein
LKLELQLSRERVGIRHHTITDTQLCMQRDGMREEAIRAGLIGNVSPPIHPYLPPPALDERFMHEVELWQSRHPGDLIGVTSLPDVLRRNMQDKRMDILLSRMLDIWWKNHGRDTLPADDDNMIALLYQKVMDELHQIIINERNEAVLVAEKEDVAASSPEDVLFIKTLMKQYRGLPEWKACDKACAKLRKKKEEKSKGLNKSTRPSSRYVANDKVDEPANKDSHGPKRHCQPPLDNNEDGWYLYYTGQWQQ